VNIVSVRADLLHILSTGIALWRPLNNPQDEWNFEQIFNILRKVLIEEKYSARRVAEIRLRFINKLSTFCG
jgi:hypothetical protein